MPKWTKKQKHNLRMHFFQKIRDIYPGIRGIIFDYDLMANGEEPSHVTVDFPMKIATLKELQRLSEVFCGTEMVTHWPDFVRVHVHADLIPDSWLVPLETITEDRS